MSSKRYTLDALNAMDRTAWTSALGAIYEHSPWIAEQTWEQRPFGSLADLEGALQATVMDAAPTSQIALIQAHPDLAGRAAIAADLTRASASEQSSVGLDRLTPDEYATFTRLNTAYRDQFGFPFVICVREHTRQSILDAFVVRLNHSGDEERTTALGEIGKIASLRLRDLIVADEEVQA